MSESLDEKWIKTVLEECEGRGLATVWSYSEFEKQTFAERCEAFFWILEKVLESGQLRLMSKGEYLSGTPKELVQRFREIFPKSNFPFLEDPELDARYWFYGIGKPEIPGIAVWRYEHPDGRVQWMPCP
jgi:hypothetical protein